MEDGGEEHSQVMLWTPAWDWLQSLLRLRHALQRDSLPGHPGLSECPESTGLLSHRLQREGHLPLRCPCLALESKGCGMPLGDDCAATLAAEGSSAATAKCWTASFTAQEAAKVETDTLCSREF